MPRMKETPSRDVRPNSPVAVPSAGIPESARSGRVTSNRPYRSLTIILPTLNEERGVTKVLSEIPWAELSRADLKTHVQILDGHSSDRTVALAEQTGAVVFVQQGAGKGAGIRELIPKLSSDYCVFLDADDTYPARYVLDLVDRLDSGDDVVLGSRFLGKIEPGAMSLFNFVGNYLLTRLAVILYGSPRVLDVCTGMWGFRTSSLKELELSANGFDIEADMYAEVSRRQLQVSEVPITYRRRTGASKLRISAGIGIAKKLILTRLRPLSPTSAE